MDAMILAAGLGTRLRPITQTTPKALVEVDGVPMLDRVARRLVAAGADRLIVNVHHLAGEVERHLATVDYGAEVRVSHEPRGLLGTGGGVTNAEPHFRGEAPFFVHNVDVISDMDLEALYAAHREDDAIATLTVQRRDTERTLLFDEAGLLGWENAATGASERVREPAGPVRRWPFAGVHVIEPAFFERVDRSGAFSIVRAYLDLVEAGRRIAPWDAGDARWLEVGNRERLARAREILSGEARG